MAWKFGSEVVRLSVVTQALTLGIICILGAILQPVSGNYTCPLDFSILNKYPYVAQQAKIKDVQCIVLSDALEMVLSEYLRNSTYFLLPPEVVPTCLDSYQSQLASQGADMNITALCDAAIPTYLSRGTDNCQGIQRISDFQRIVSNYTMNSVNQSCSGTLSDGDYSQNVECAACTKQMSSLTSYLQAYNASGVHSGCQNYSSMYVAAVVNTAGPEDAHTASCLFSIFPIKSQKKKMIGAYIAIGAIASALVGVGVALLCYVRYRRRKIAEQKAFVKRNTDLLEGSMQSGNGSLMFTIEEIKSATRNFSREMIIGSGAYGNVFKGILKNGQEVAIKVCSHQLHTNYSFHKCLPLVVSP